MSREVGRIAVAVHIADHRTDAVQPFDRFIVFVEHLHLVIAADAADGRQEPRRTLNPIERAGLDRKQKFLALVEVFVHSLFTETVIALDRRDRRFLRQSQLFNQPEPFISMVPELATISSQY